MLNLGDRIYITKSSRKRGSVVAGRAGYVISAFLQPTMQCILLDVIMVAPKPERKFMLLNINLARNVKHAILSGVNVFNGSRHGLQSLDALLINLSAPCVLCGHELDILLKREKYVLPIVFIRKEPSNVLKSRDEFLAWLVAMIYGLNNTFKNFAYLSLISDGNVRQFADDNLNYPYGRYYAMITKAQYNAFIASLLTTYLIHPGIQLCDGFVPVVDADFVPVVDADNDANDVNVFMQRLRSPRLLVADAYNFSRVDRLRICENIQTFKAKFYTTLSKIMIDRLIEHIYIVRCINNSNVENIIDDVKHLRRVPLSEHNNNIQLFEKYYHQAYSVFTVISAAVCSNLIPIEVSKMLLRTLGYKNSLNDSELKKFMEEFRTMRKFDKAALSRLYEVI